MLDHCPHCQQALKLSESQEEKIRTALAALPAGRTLKIACPSCREAIELNRDGSMAEPVLDAMAEVLYGEHAGYEDQAAEKIVAMARTKPRPAKLPPAAPAPPDLSWLTSGTYNEKEIIENVPHAMIMMGNPELTARVGKIVGDLGYQPMTPNSAEEAIAKMQFMNFDLVILHCGFEGGTLAESSVHQYLREMAMARRRYLFYVLAGPEFRTFYALEALANSANLVVNDRDLPHLALLLKKGLHDNDELFGPYIEALGKYGVK